MILNLMSQMKKILITLSILLTAFVADAQVDSLYSSAIQSYDQGDFEKALELFRSIKDQGQVSGELFYNMGNAAFRSNQIGYAILYYEKALKEDPGYENAKVNLNFVSRYKEDQLESVPELSVRSWMRTLVRLFNSGTWALLALLLFILTLASLFLYIFSARTSLRKTGFFTALAAFLIFLLALLSGIRQHQREKNPEEAIVISSSVIVRSTPNSSGNDLFVLHEGTKVDLLDEVTGWQNIRISDGRVGWIAEDAIEAI